MKKSGVGSRGEGLPCISHLIQVLLYRASWKDTDGDIATPLLVASSFIVSLLLPCTLASLCSFHRVIKSLAKRECINKGAQKFLFCAI